VFIQTFTHNHKRGAFKLKINIFRIKLIIALSIEAAEGRKKYEKTSRSYKLIGLGCD
jgi:hypothetical protein